MTLVLDAGALVALERNSRRVDTAIKREILAGTPPITHGGVVGQVWRGGTGRQANLARWLPALKVVALDANLGRRAGVLLGRSRTRDVIDAAVVLLAKDGDQVMTSDPEDLSLLATVARTDLDILPV